MPKPAVDPHVVKICKQYGIPTKSNKDDPEAPFWFHDQSKQHLMKASWINILAAKAKVELNHMSLEHVSEDRGQVGKTVKRNVPLYVVVKVDGWITLTNDDVFKWSALGECTTPGNNSNTYPAAMAEKRAKSRLILMLTGLYGFIYSEDEMGDTASFGDSSGSNAPAEPVLDDAKAWALDVEKKAAECETVEQLKALWDGAQAQRKAFGKTEAGEGAVMMAKECVEKRLEHFKGKAE